MEFTSGIDALQQAIEEGNRKAEAAKGGSGKSLNYFNWKPGDKKVVRFLADDMITEEFYDFIVDNTGNTKNFMVDPSDPNRLARFMSPTPGVGWRKHPKTGVLEPPKARKMTVCVAVLRNEVPHSSGKGTVIEDFLIDKDVDGQTVPARYFGIVQQSIPNFWHTLAVSCFKRYGTICDRDYEITRTGTGFDTKYDILPLPEIAELLDTEAVKSFYFYGQEWSPEDSQRLLKCPMTTAQWAEYFSSEDRHKHWLGPKTDVVTPAGGYTPSGNDEFHPDTTHNDEAQAQRTSGTNFASLQDTLLKNAKR